MVAWLAVKVGSGSLKEIGKRFGRDGSTMSIAICRIEHRARESQGFHRQLERFKEYKYSTSQAFDPLSCFFHTSSIGFKNCSLSDFKTWVGLNWIFPNRERENSVK